MSETTNTTATETQRPWYVRGETWGVIGTLAFGSALMSGQVISARINDKAMKRDAVIERGVADQVQLDGFTAEGVDNWGRGSARGGLRISPNCALGNVTMRYTLGPDRQVTDVTDYTFTTIINGNVTYRRNPQTHRRESNVEGQPVSFTFVNLGDLQQNVLGEQPCETLALNVGIVAENN
jgi:hypothetical protein